MTGIPTTQLCVDPFLVRRYYPEQELIDKAIQWLKQYGLYPSKPQNIDVELLAEQIARFDYADFPPSYEGMTQFSLEGLPSIYISRALSAPKTPHELARYLFVVAHECGHVIMHNQLYRLACSYWRQEPQAACAYRTFCSGVKDYSNYKWYEWQASTVGAYLLIPPPLLKMVMDEVINTPVISRSGRRGSNDPGYAAVRLLDIVKNTFEVTRTTAKIALERYLAANPDYNQHFQLTHR